MPKPIKRQKLIDIKPLTTSNEVKQSPHPDLPKTVLRGIIVGNSGSGKSVLLQNLFGRSDLYGGIFQPENMVIMSPTLDVFDPFPMLKKAIKIKDHNKFVPTLITLLEHVKKMSHEHGPEKIPPICVIIDDCSVEKKLFLYNGIIDEFFLTGRNYNISTIVVAHRLNLLSRNVKLNVNFACLFPCVNYSEVESFIVQFCDKPQRDFVYFAVSEVFKEKYHFVFVNTEADRENQLRNGFHIPLYNADFRHRYEKMLGYESDYESLDGSSDESSDEEQ